MDEGREMHASANGWKEHEKAATYPIVEGDEKEEKDGGWKGNVEDADAGEVSVDELVNQTGFGPYQRKLLILCGCGWAADIMDLQVMSFLIPALIKDWQETPSRLSLAPSATFVGMLLGSLFWGIVSDRIGRKPAFTATSLWAGTCGMMCGTANGIWMLMFWRLLMGFALGGNLAVDFSLFMEFVPTSVRGKFTVLLTVFATLGSLTCAGLAWCLLDVVGWRVYAVMCSAPGILVGILRTFMHESPHFLAVTGNSDEARRVLLHVAAANGVKLDIQDGTKITALDNVQASTLQTLSRLMKGNLRNRLLLMSSSWFALSFGFYGYSVWGPTYFAARGFQPSGVYQAIFLSVLVQIPGTMLAALVVEKKGRRIPLICFSIGCMVAVSGIAFFADKTAMVCFSLILNFCTAGLWAVTYTNTPEVFPTALRTTCMGVCSCVARLAGIIVSLMGGTLLSTSVEASISTYAAAYAVVAVLSFHMRMDMTGRHLSEAAMEERRDGDGTNLLVKD